MNKEIIEFWQKLKHLGQTVFQEAERASKVVNEDALVICYFLKCENTAYSIMVLLDRCFVQDAGILARALFENVVYLIASTRDKDFIKRFGAEFDVQKNKLLVRVDKHYQIINEEELSAGEEKTHFPISQEKAREIKDEAEAAKDNRFEKDFLEGLCKEYSTERDLEKDYNMIYKNFHTETHSLPPAVRKYSADTGFVHYPDLKNIDLTAFITFEYFLKACKAVLNYFQIPLTEGWDELDTGHLALRTAYVQNRNEAEAIE